MTKEIHTKIKEIEAFLTEMNNLLKEAGFRDRPGSERIETLLENLASIESAIGVFESTIEKQGDTIANLTTEHDGTCSIVDYLTNLLKENNIEI